MASNILEKANNPLISIIIPVYNRSGMLNRLFNSLLKIDYQPIEILLIDNNSNDISYQLCQDFQTKCHEVFNHVVVDKEPRKGACACRNKGARLAQGDFLFFFDSDDEISPDFLSDLAPYLPLYDVVGAPTMMFFANGKSKRRDCIATAYPHDQILSASISTQSIIVSKTFMEKVGFWDESLFRWNDWELGVRMLCHQPRIKWITQKAYHKIHQHAESISGQSFLKDHKILLDSLDKAKEDIAESNIGEKLKRKGLNALAYKHLILSCNVFREGNKDVAALIYQKGKSYLGGWRVKAAYPLLLLLGRMGCPGIWRICRWCV